MTRRNVTQDSQRRTRRSTLLPEAPFVRPAWRRYSVALLSVFLGWCLRAAMTPEIGPSALPFITFFPVIAWAAWYGGLGPAIVALVLASLVANWFFLAPVHSLRVDDHVAYVAFLVSAGIMVAAVEMMHRARRELAAARDLLATTLSSIGDGVIVTDEAGRVTFLNPEAERLTGWRNADGRGRPLAEVFHIVNEETRLPAESPVDRVLRTGTVVGLANHTVVIAKDGSETPIDDSAAPVQLADAPVLGVVLVFRDVRKERRAAEARAQLAAIVDTSGDAILSKGLDGTVRTWNAGAERMFGYSAAEIVGKSIMALVPDDRAGEEHELLQRLGRGLGTARLQTVRVAKDGRRIDVSVTNSALRDPAGKITGASLILHDMTDTVAAQKALAREKELLGTTLASIGDAVIATDARGNVTFMNPVAERLTGWTHAEAAGRPLPDVFRIVDESSRSPVENPAMRAMAHGVVVGLANHTMLIPRTGAPIPIDDSAAPIRDERQTVVGSVLVFRDITERKRLDAELRSRIEQLAEVDRRRSEFLATLAHELRNPLAPIRNSITLLQILGPPDPDLKTARDVIDRQVRQMSRLLDDLLDVNRLERGKLELKKERVLLATVVENAVETARPAIASAGHRLSVELPQEKIFLDADPMRLAQVFANLLNNAAKYMDAGGKVALVGVRDGAHVVVSVQDAGIGIDAKSLPTLFEMFAQVPMALERAQGGVGIGLALAKGLVELHGGTISVRSGGLGKGSTFTVRLPVASEVAPPAVLPSAPASANVPARRILLADDVKDNADTLAMMLRALGHDVHVVYDGERAVAAAGELRPEVVLLDIGMPKLDGYEACRRIRAAPWGERMYLIAQTGWGQDIDRRRAKDAGFDKHLLKPVDCAALEAVLSSLPRARASP